MVQALWRTVWRFLKKLKIELPCVTAVPLLSIYPERKMIPPPYFIEEELEAQVRGFPRFHNS